MTRVVIKRKKLLDEFEVKKWKLVYGRRKTGKTFFVKNFVKWDKYYYVTRGKGIKDIKTRERITYRELERIIEMGKDSKIVIDEFHRLGDEFLDFLHSLAGQGADLILITSSLHFSKEILGKRSPLLGLVYPIRFSLLKPSEVLGELSKFIKGKELFERSVFLIEPSLIHLFNEKDFEMKLFKEIKTFVPALLGEIFTEEEKKLTEVYDGVLHSIANGKKTSGEIASYLKSNDLLKKGDPKEISYHLNTLMEVEIIGRVKVFGTKKEIYHYFIESPAVDFYYYLDSKYGISFVEKEDIKEAFRNKLPFYTERFFEKLLIEIFGGHSVKISRKDLEIDIALKKLKKINLVVEVKWRKKISSEEVKESEEKLLKFKNCRRILIVPEKNYLEHLPEKVEVWDTKKFLDILSRLD